MLATMLREGRLRRFFFVLALMPALLLFASGPEPGRAGGEKNPLTERAKNVSPAREDAAGDLCRTDGLPDFAVSASPKATPFVVPLFIPPIAKAEPKNKTLFPRVRESSHQKYPYFKPKKFYVQEEQEIQWEYHTDPPYNRKTWSWGINGTTPGPTFHAYYNEPILVRRYNRLPDWRASRLRGQFALPRTTRHLHNGHTASESDGFPHDYLEQNKYWDHHYPNIPSGLIDPTTGQPDMKRWDEREQLTTLWYHDHAQDFTAANVYAGLDGFYFLFDKHDTGDENDGGDGVWNLPSGDYDIPLVLHDLLFDDKAQLVFDPRQTNGILGDQYTVNRKIRPYLDVEQRKYRFRILDGGPSRFYELFLEREDGGPISKRPFVVITGDGNFLPEPCEAPSIYLGVGQRVDVILDFAAFEQGTKLYLKNRLDQVDGQGPSGRHVSDDPKTHQHSVMQFRVKDSPPSIKKNKSRIPARFRESPPIDFSRVKQRRLWKFDNTSGTWNINGETMPKDGARSDAQIEEGSAEIWTFRNTGTKWSHPIHSHLTEFRILEINGVPVYDDSCQIHPRVTGPDSFDSLTKRDEKGKRVNITSRHDYQLGTHRLGGPFMGGPRRDVALLLPDTEMKVYMEWRDFYGRYVLHCHNVVHEDHAMMLRWDVIPARPRVNAPQPAAAPPAAGARNKPPGKK